MAWIELHDNVKEHRKTWALADCLGITSAHAVGLLACLWTWAIANAIDGDLAGFPARAISQAAGWTKKPDLFVDAMVTSGYVDSDMHIHDWDEYAGMLIDRRERNKAGARDRKQKQRDKQRSNTQHVTQADTSCHDDVTRDMSRCHGSTVTYTDTLTNTVSKNDTPPFIPPDGNEDEPKRKKKSPQAADPDFPAMLDERAFTVPLRECVEEWVRYKAERKETYKPTGFKNLLTIIAGHAATHGDEAVVDVMRLTMASGWQGIVWDKLPSQQCRKPKHDPGGWFVNGEEMDKARFDEEVAYAKSVQDAEWGFNDETHFWCRRATPCGTGPPTQKLA